MGILNGKRMSSAELNRLRLQAVALRLRKVPTKQITLQTGLTLPTILSAYNCFLKGGWAAVHTGARGRPPGSRRAQPYPDHHILHELAVTLPEQANKQAILWTVALLRQWVNSRFTLTLTERTALRYAERWGLNPSVVPPSVLSPDRGQPVTHTGETLAELQRRARRVGRSLLVGGLGAFTTADLNDKATIASPLSLQSPSSVAQVYARDLRGSLHWLHREGVATTDLLLDFFQRLLQLKPNGVLLLFNSFDLGRYAEVNEWLVEHQNSFELIPFSRAPGLSASLPIPSMAGEAGDSSHSVLSTHTDPTQSLSRNPMPLTHLQRLEAESMQIMREVVAESDNPVMLYSIGKDSAVMLHLAMKAFYPSIPPFPLLHVDTTWKFRDMYEFRDRMVKACGMQLLIHTNPEGIEKGINPFTHGSAIHTDIMKTEGLKQALNKYGFDVAFGGARRDEEKSRAKERIFSFRSTEHRWDPKDQRPELWKLYNSRKHKGESIRVFPISNWTELDIWQYIHLENIPIVPLYLAAERPVVERDGMLIMVDDERMPLKPGEVPMLKSVRFRTLGCYPLTGAVESTAATLPAVIQEMLLTKTSERQGRMIDHDSAASMEKKKQEGYF